MFFYIFFLFFYSFHSLLNCFYHYLSISQIFFLTKTQNNENERRRSEMTHQRGWLISTLTHRAQKFQKSNFDPSQSSKDAANERMLREDCICQVQTFENAPRPVPKLKSHLFSERRRTFWQNEQSREYRKAQELYCIYYRRFERHWSFYGEENCCRWVRISLYFKPAG